MVSFNTLKNTVAASALGLATTLGGCTAKQGKTFLRNTNQLERTIEKDAFTKNQQFIQYVDSIRSKTGMIPDTLYKELFRAMEQGNKTDRKLLDGFEKLIGTDTIDISKIKIQ